jgi:hypothetical protein
MADIFGVQTREESEVLLFLSHAVLAAVSLLPSIKNIHQWIKPKHKARQGLERESSDFERGG